MADFKTHVTFSSVLGCGYAFAGMTAGIETSTSLVAGGLCGLSGMLPDVDSDSGIPRRETMGFAAAIVPMLLVERFQQAGLRYDEMVLAAAALYFGIRFGVSKLIGHFSVHRGMWHSIPAALIFAGLAFLITRTTDPELKYFKAFAVFLGVMSHLVLDEVYSVDTRGVVPKFKKSFGTAVKFYGKNSWANFSTYAKLVVVALLVFGDWSTLPQMREDGARLAGAKLGEWGDRIRTLADEGIATTPSPPSVDGVEPAPEAAWGPPSTPNLQGGFAPNAGAYRPIAPAAPPHGYTPGEPTYPTPQPAWNQPRR